MIVYNYKIVYIGFEFKEEPFNNSEFVTSPWYTYIDYINIYIGGREIETWVTVLQIEGYQRKRNPTMMHF